MSRGPLAVVGQEHVTEHEVHKFVTEASDIGLPVGEWPFSLQTTLGNGQPFIRVRPDMRDGEIMGVHYRQALGCISLLVVND